MLTKEEAKREIRLLLEKYQKVVEDKKINKYTEEETKKDFILPLFRALGWSVENSEEVSAEEKISKKRVDYGFRIQGIPKFFLEAKSLKADLNNLEFIQQAINYSWHKGCTWAILTDFESIKIFNAEWKTNNPFQNHIKTIPCQEYLDRFEELWLFSKESFEKGLLDIEAEKWGKKTKKSPVDKQLLEDFTRFRELLSKKISRDNQKEHLNEEELDEAIQRILDRLIFIRSCEDRGLEEKRLWEAKNEENSLKKLKEIFRYFDQNYDSNLFREHLCDNLEIENKIIQEIIEGLYYTKDKSLAYDFSAIEADVLGNIYEQYLGHIIKKGEIRAKLDKNHAHRKEQGIYYTPTYIVDYIVRHTLGEMLKNKKIKADKIKLLDPACGSGSFLIKSFDILRDYYAKHDKNYHQEILADDGTTYSIKERILKNNIFGVDLDKQAVEIAQLNLLLKIAEKGHRLPLLQQNIKNGNSLIDNPAVAGDKAFKWEEQFKQIMDEGGFDIIIGNPPYGYRGIPTPEIKEAYGKKYVTSEGNFDMYRFFIERSINLLREGGTMGFIIPNTFLSATSYKKLRKYLLDNCSIEEIMDVGLAVFEGVTVESIILILKKNSVKSERNKQKVDISICRSRDKSITEPTNTYFISQSKFNETKDNNFNIYLDPKTSQITKRIENSAVSLEKIAYVTVGINTGYIKNVLVADKKVDNRYHKLLSGRDISRYFLKWPGQWILYDKKVVDNYGDKGRTLPDESIFKEDKVLVQRTRRGMARKLICTLDNEQYYNLNRLGNIVIRDKGFSLKYCLGILNSKLMDYYFQKTFNEYEVKPAHLRQLPIKQVTLSEQQIIIKLVDKMLTLNKRLNDIGDKKTDEKARIEEEIKKTDNEIDEEVYKLYGITAEEKKIIEESLK